MMGNRVKEIIRECAEKGKPVTAQELSVLTEQARAGFIVFRCKFQKPDFLIWPSDAEAASSRP
jgi:hypothetical protein